jgi:predicted RNase H-like HicB family nuclease
VVSLPAILLKPRRPERRAVPSQVRFLPKNRGGAVRLRFKSSRGCVSLLEGFIRNEFTAVFERDGSLYVAYCPEVPGANGQGSTRDEARDNLAEAIALILEDRREDGLRGVPADAEREFVTVNIRGAA